jgi:hypothetical protein
MKKEHALRAALTRIVHAARPVFRNDDTLQAGHSVDGESDNRVRAKLRTAIENAEKQIGLGRLAR